jgi:hypothetical protein
MKHGIELPTTQLYGPINRLPAYAVNPIPTPNIEQIPTNFTDVAEKRVCLNGIVPPL